MDHAEQAADLATAAAARSRGAPWLPRSGLDDAELEASSELLLSRLTVVCHLRFGTQALLRMTRDALGGRETAFYPRGRHLQRAETLQPAPNESPDDVLAEFRFVADALDREWSVLTPQQWSVQVIEPADNPDLGSIPLAGLALARLTEVEVHGTDLGIGAADWSSTFVEVGLPARLRVLERRRTNHRGFDPTVRGSWRLESTEGLSWAGRRRCRRRGLASGPRSGGGRRLRSSWVPAVTCWRC